jgi:class 3 adenylate cyclase
VVKAARFCSACGATVAAAPAVAERRKVVTVVFADVVGSTAFGEHVDPETLRWAMQRWFGRMAATIERHGGTVENYIGDAVMAVFGVPTSHEDDALRAVRAAAEMRAAVAVLRAELRRERNLDFDVRIGVNTGEAVTGSTATGGLFTAGDIVNVAARLEQSARPGDILLGRDTFRLVRHAVDAEPVVALSLKGKAAAVDAFRLESVAADAPARRSGGVRRWSIASASASWSPTPSRARSPIAPAGCSPSSARRASASRGSSARSSTACKAWRR